MHKIFIASLPPDDARESVLAMFFENPKGILACKRRFDAKGYASCRGARGRFVLRCNPLGEKQIAPPLRPRRRDYLD
jgi:hypothetical protein